MSTKKEYLNLIRWSCLVESFTINYFSVVIVLYLLNVGVTNWVAVSIPVVLEFFRLLARTFPFAVKFALKVNYKKYHILHIAMVILLGLIISSCRSVYSIYLFCAILGFLSGVKYSSVTAIDTSNKEYEPYCFIEEERANGIGSILGLVTSQILFSISPLTFIIGYIVVGVIGLLISINLNNIKIDDVMESIDESDLDKTAKNNTIIVSILFGIIAGLWCMAWSGLGELAPLISDKVGYINAAYYAVEFVLLFIISGNLIKKIKEKRKLLATEIVIACVDCICLLIASLTLSWWGLLIAFLISAVGATLGDPLWGSIVSEYSLNDRKRYVIVNKVYFIVRTIFTALSWYFCRECIIKGVESFKYMAIILFLLLILTYIVANIMNKKIFSKSV